MELMHTRQFDELHEDGEDAVSLDTTTFSFALMEFTYLLWISMPRGALM
jgi:hypothetical protein